VTGELSGRERAVLVLKANGATHQQAANHLCTTLPTVTGILVCIYTKLGVENCTNAVAVALVLNEINGHEIQIPSHLKATTA
jgi:ATP/maltotriose-dependent transcriptional regulator MalT